MSINKSILHISIFFDYVHDHFQEEMLCQQLVFSNELRLLLPLKHGGLIYVSVKQHPLLCYIADHINWLNAT